MNSPPMVKQAPALPEGFSAENKLMIHHFPFDTRRPEHNIRPGEWIKTQKLNLPLQAFLKPLGQPSEMLPSSNVAEEGSRREPKVLNKPAASGDVRILAEPQQLL